MTVLFNHFFTIARITIAMLLVVALCLKMGKAFINTEIKKEFSLLNKADTNEEKKSETDMSERGSEFIQSDNNFLNFITGYTIIVHNTIYSIKYISSYYNKIAIPPPDINLHTLI